MSLLVEQKKQQMKDKIRALNDNNTRLTEGLRALEKELGQKKELLQSFEFECEELKIALRERDAFIKSLQDNLAKASTQSSSSSEGMRRKVEELKATVASQKAEIAQATQNFQRMEQSFERAYEQLKMKNASYQIQLRELKEKSESFKSNQTDFSQSDMSVKKITDFIRMESELRQKNEQIESLKETIKSIQRSSLRPGPLSSHAKSPQMAPSTFVKKSAIISRPLNFPLDIKSKLFDKDRLKSNR